MIQVKPTYTGNCWPKDKLLWLMQAAMLDGAEALDAFEKWSSQLDIDKIDELSYQIIPKLYSNLRKLNVSHPCMGIFAGIYRKTWVTNKKNFYLFSKLMQALHANGIEDIVLLKGGAMILSCYQDFGIRQMGDIDFLISKECALKAILQLMDLGFQIVPPTLHTDIQSLKDEINIRHGINFMGTESQYHQLYVDVHWNILANTPHHNIDLNWIKNSDVQMLYDVKVSTLDPTFLLYQTCIHGASYSPVPLTRWVMDAVTLIQLKNEQINWDELIKQAAQDHQLLAIQVIMNYLVENFQATIPSHVMSELNQHRALWVEKLYFRCKTSAWLSLLLLPTKLWTQHARVMPNSGFFQNPGHFLVIYKGNVD